MTLPPPINTPEVKEAMPDIVVSPEEVQVLLSQIKPGKAPGPNDITSRFLHEFSKEITQALKLIFSTSLYSGELPQDWLHARVSQYTKVAIRIKAPQKVTAIYI